MSNNFVNQFETNNLNIANSAQFQFVKNAYLKTDGNGAVIATENSDDGSSPDAGGTIGAKVGRFDKINRYNEGDTGVIEIPNVYVPVELQSDNLTARGNTYMYGDVTFTDGSSDKEKGDVVFEKQPLFEKGIRSYNASANPLITAEYHQITGKNTSGFVSPDPSRQDDGPKLVVGYRPESSDGGKGKLQLLVGDSDYNGIGKGKWIVLAQQDVKRRGVPSSGTDDIEPYSLDSVLLEPTNPDISQGRKLLLQYNNEMDGLTVATVDQDGTVGPSSQVATVGGAGGVGQDTYTDNIYSQNFLSFFLPQNGDPTQRGYFDQDGFHLNQNCKLLVNSLSTGSRSSSATIGWDNTTTFIAGNDLYDDNRTLSLANSQGGVVTLSMRNNTANDSGGDLSLFDMCWDFASKSLNFVFTTKDNFLNLAGSVTSDGLWNLKRLFVSGSIQCTGPTTLGNTTTTGLTASGNTILQGNLNVNGANKLATIDVPMTVSGDTNLNGNVGISNSAKNFTVASKSTFNSDTNLAGTVNVNNVNSTMTVAAKAIFNNTVSLTKDLASSAKFLSGNEYMRIPYVLNNTVTRLQPINFDYNRALIYPTALYGVNPFSYQSGGLFSLGQAGIFQVEANLFFPNAQPSGSRLYGLALMNQTDGTTVTYSNYSGNIRDAFTFSATLFLDRAKQYYMTINADSTGGASPTYTTSADPSLCWFSIYRLA